VKKSILVTVLLLITTMAPACQLVREFQEPSSEECEVAFEHLVKLSGRGEVADPLAREVAEGIVNWLADKSGTKDRMVKKCMVKASRADTDCLINAESLDVARNCEFFAVWDE